MNNENPKLVQENAEYPMLRLLKDLPAAALLTEIMTSLYNITIMVWDENGTILCANDVVARGFRRKSVDELLGKNIAEFGPPEWAQERIEVAQQAIKSNQRISLMEILGGYRLRSCYRPLITTVDGKTNKFVAVTIEQITPLEFKHACTQMPDELILHAQYNDLGRLDVLSPRELEILALMGEGLRAKDIAKQLCRSVKTIDNHRDSIGHKLGVSDRSELIAIAHLAVLRVEDANCKRVQFSKVTPQTN